MKDYLMIFLAGMLANLFSAWMQAIPYVSAVWGQSVVFFMVSWLMLRHYGGARKQPLILLSLLLGMVFINLPNYLTDFRAILPSFYATVACVVAVGCSAVYYRSPKPVTLAVITVVAVLVNTVGAALWNAMVA